VSDPATGRFWQIDPLAEDFMYNSTYAFQENKMGMGVELEGRELLGWDMMASVDATINPNGVGAHAIGIAEGVASSVQGTIDAISNPVQTAQGVGNLLLASALKGDPAMMAQADAALGTNSTGAANGLVTSIENGANDLINGNGVERGNVIGQIGMAVVGSKGTNAVVKATSTALKSTKATTLFRAVSKAELDDIGSNGLRTANGSYETGKLFTTTPTNASQFGKYNFKFDLESNTIIQVKVPNSVMKTTTRFTADGMPAVSIPSNQLSKIKQVTPLNQSPIPNN